MTREELSQLFYLNREIEMDEQRLEMLMLRSQPGAQVLDGMPRSSGTSDRTGRYALAIVALSNAIDEKRQYFVRERIRIERHIAGIDDDMIRQILTYRFMDGLRWRQVARRIGGTATEDSVRQRCSRYLRASTQA